MMRRITNTNDLAEGAEWLCQTEPRFAPALAATGPLRLRRKPAGFEALLNMIISQQVSVASANAIWAKLEAADLTTQSKVLDVNEETLRQAGLSRQKARYARALAEAEIAFDTLADMPTTEIIRQLTAVTGIGVWTAEIYAMFSVGHADVMAAGDLALQEAARILFNLEDRPTEKQLRVIAEAWSPWRSVAACLLWQYYHVVKSREGIR